MSIYRLGQFLFLSMSRFPHSHLQRLEREAAAGFAGVTFWRTGIRSEPFQVTTVVDAPTLIDAENLMRLYEASVGTVADVWWAGRHLGDYMIGHVEPLEGGLHAMLLAVGGLNQNNPQALLRVSWTLEYVPNLNPQQQ